MWISVFFGGIWQFIRNIFSWKNKTPFWRVIWVVITTCIVVFTCMVGYAFYDEFYSGKSDIYWNRYDPNLSPDFKFRNNGYDAVDSYIYNSKTNKKVLTGIEWIARSLDGDSLIVVAKDGKRGFFNRFTGEMTIPLKYDAAWIFSDGVAAVCEGDSVYFIDHSGKPINNKKYARTEEYNNYAYHGEYAAIPEKGKYGLVDRKGAWAILPEYDDIIIGPRDLWHVYNNDKWAVVGANGQFIMPIEYESVWIQHDKGITVARADDHSQSRYDYDGTLLDKFIFDEVFEMAYYIDEFDEDGNQKRAIDSMMKYTANCHFGLMTRDGVPVTPPLYYNISCVAPGVYQCQISGYMSDCIMVNAKGEKINE